MVKMEINLLIHLSAYYLHLISIFQVRILVLPFMCFNSSSKQSLINLVPLATLSLLLDQEIHLQGLQSNSF